MSQITSATSPTLESLIDAIAQKRDKQAFIQLFNLMAGKLKLYAIRCGANEQDAEEIVQEALISVWHKAEQFNPKTAAASTWLFRIVRNKRIDFVRKSRPDQIQSFDLFPEQGGEALEIDAESDLTAQFTRTLIECLPDEQRQIVYQVYFEGKTHSEIANEMDLPLGTIKSRLRLALTKLDSLAKEHMSWLIIILLTTY